MKMLSNTLPLPSMLMRMPLREKDGGNILNPLRKREIDGIIIKNDKVVCGPHKTKKRG
jgi:hypothetical protein